VTRRPKFNSFPMPPLQPLVEDENERPDVEVIEALLGKRLKVCSCRCYKKVSRTSSLVPRQTHQVHLLLPSPIEGHTCAQLKTLSDRDFTGTLVCLDKLGNVLLFDAIENCTIGHFQQDRSLGQIIVPLKHIKQTQVQVRLAKFAQPDWGLKICVVHVGAKNERDMAACLLELGSGSKGSMNALQAHVPVADVIPPDVISPQPSCSRLHMLCRWTATIVCCKYC
jgi:small nuclear ribonucleoprotein (snRNP)-like protein